MTKRLLMALTVLYVVGVGDACQLKPKTTLTRDEFFTQNPQLGGDYFASLPLLNPDSCNLRLRAEVPPEWWCWAMEGIYYRLPEDCPDSIVNQHLELALRSFRADSTRAVMLKLQGVELLRGAHTEEAQKVLEESIDISLHNKDSLRAGDAQRYLATCYLIRGDYVTAIERTLGVVELFAGLNDTIHPHRKFEILLELSRTYLRAKDNQQALECQRKAWRWVSQYDQFEWARQFKADASEEMAVSFIGLKEPDSTLYWLELNRSLCQQYDLEGDEENYYWYKSKALVMKGLCAKSLPFALKALQMWKEQDNLQLLLRCQVVVGECYQCLGRLDSAEWCYLDALRTPDTIHLLSIHQKLALLYEGQGQLAKALQHTKIAHQLYSANFTSEKTKALGRLEAQGELKVQRQMLVAAAEKRRATQWQALTVVLLLSLILSGALFAFDRQRRQRLLLQKEKQLLETREQLQRQILEETQADLEVKNQELKEAAKVLALKNRLIEELHLNALAPATGDAASFANQSLEINALRRMKILTDEDWLAFRNAFDQAVPGFLTRLQRTLGKLTAGETRLFLLLKLNFDTSEIADVLGISVESVWKSRHRLRKKLGLAENSDLDTFVKEF